MSKRFCACGSVIDGSGCGKCKASTGKAMLHRTTTQRGYGSDWKALSERYRMLHSLCEDCLTIDKVTPAAEVHHVVPISVNPDMRLDWSNLVALCRNCHEQRHG